MLPLELAWSLVIVTAGARAEYENVEGLRGTPSSIEATCLPINDRTLAVLHPPCYSNKKIVFCVVSW